MGKVKSSFFLSVILSFLGQGFMDLLGIKQIDNSGNNTQKNDEEDDLFKYQGGEKVLESRVVFWNIAPE